MDQKVFDYAINELGFTLTQKPDLFGGEIYWLKKKISPNEYLWLQECGWLYLVEIRDGIKQGVLLSERIETEHDLNSIVLKY